VRDLLADERCSPAVLDFLRSTHVGRVAPPVEENWNSEDEAEEAEADEAEVDEVEEQAELTRELLVSGFICNFLGVFLASLSLPWCSVSAHYLSAEVLPSSPTFGAERQTGLG